MTSSARSLSSPTPGGAPEDRRSTELAALREAFTAFTQSTRRLEDAYAHLERRAQDLNLELQSRNDELTVSLREMDSIRNHLKYILESMKMGVVVVNLDGIITVFNTAATTISGIPAAQAVGRDYADVFGSILDGDERLLRTLHDGVEVSGEERILRHCDGRLVPIELSVSQVRSEEGQVLGAVGIFGDLTPLRALQEEVAQARTLAALGEMAANVAHEIRNPLGGIGGFAALLERDLDVEDPRRRLVKKIIEGVASLNRIAANLLFFTRPMHPTLRRMPVVPVVEEVLQLVEMETEQARRAIRIVKEYAEGAAVARIDPDLLQQALLNLAKNAADAMEAEGTLRVAVCPESSGYLTVTIEDTGCGIPEEELRKLFSPFYTTKTNGTGLGLAIVKKIVDVHHGRIEVSSTVGRGTTFRIHVPQ